MNKKIMGLVLVGMLSVGAVGCGNDTIEYQEPQAQQEQTVDEDLTPQYQEKINKENELEMAKTIIDSFASEHFDTNEFQIKVDEESNTIMFIFLTNQYVVANGIQDGSYFTLKEAMIENSLVGKNLLEECGLNVNYSVCLGNVVEDTIWLGIVNGEVLYDCTQN